MGIEYTYSNMILYIYVEITLQIGEWKPPVGTMIGPKIYSAVKETPLSFGAISDGEERERESSNLHLKKQSLKKWTHMHDMKHRDQNITIGPITNRQIISIKGLKVCGGQIN